jgi:kumamolisin
MKKNFNADSKSGVKSQLGKLGYSSAVIVATGLSSVLVAQADVSCHLSEQPTQIVFSHIPKAAKAMLDVGKLPGDQVLPVMFSLKLNNEKELDQRLSQMYRPGSGSYHRFMTPDEFRDDYGATEDQIGKEKQFLEANGIVVQSVSKNHVFMHAQASVNTLNKVFKTELHQYLRSDGKLYFSPAYEIKIPEGSQIDGVIGLNNVTKLHSQILKGPQKKANGSTPEGGAPGGGLAPADITRAYEIPDSATGEGQTLALFELDAYDPSDIAAYENQFHLPNVNLQNIYVDGAAGQQPGEGADEVSLDIEMMIAMAPKAKKILVYEGPIADASGDIKSFEEGYIDVIEKIADDNLAQQISSSWGSAEDQFSDSDMKAESVVYQQMAAQGQTFYAASGDDGADDDQSTLSVDNPASQPYVVGVGGTTLSIDPSGARSSETVWNELSNSEGAGGGGISKVWSIPDWQKNKLASDKQASDKMRNVPDVSLNADPETGYGIYTQGSWQVVGGTSASAPLWAAFNALVNEKRSENKLSPTGFLAPKIYAAGGSASYLSDFYDITVGANGTGKDSFSSFVGYDNATGWGVFRGAGLLQQLSQDLF